MGPVFLLAGGGRTGSTMLQRLILSTRQVLIWGEHGGKVIKHLQEIIGDMKIWLKDEGSLGGFQQKQFLEKGHNAWIPNMNPSIDNFYHGCRELLQESLGRSAKELGYQRWGFKEIRYGYHETLFLQELFPDACFIIIVRNPIDCLRSIKSTNWYSKEHVFGGNPLRFLSAWAKLSSELYEVRPRLNTSLFLRYEDITDDPESAVANIAEITGINKELFNQEIFKKKIRGAKRLPPMLEENDFIALHDLVVRGAAEELGYKLDGFLL